MGYPAHLRGLGGGGSFCHGVREVFSASSIRSYLYRRPCGMAARPAFRYGMLVAYLGLLALNIGIATAYRSFDSFSLLLNFFVCSVLLLSHLAWNFWFGPKISPALRVAADVWLAVGFFFSIYIFLIFR